MERTMKWHIYNMDHEPLCWDFQALEFDAREDAEKFLKSIPISAFEDEKPIIVEDILYYDDGYIDATGCVVEFTDDDAYLVAGE